MQEIAAERTYGCAFLGFAELRGATRAQMPS
jgi:hypothetical protein